MRPIRLELEGFASFREATTVDFDGADLFVLTGATGAGKTSVLDGLVFALFGSVPRYDDRRLVAPVISQGKNDARVRLDFAVGEDRYTAVRIVRRTPSGGASTKEARLEDADGTTLAGNESELTAAVEDLLGLSFDHFTRCVVLPQGDFQEFLHARPRERQDLLIRLLDLDVYRQVASMARERATAADAIASLLTARLEDDLRGATPEARDAAAARVEQVQEVLRVVDEARPRLEAIVEEGRDARRRADAADTTVAALRTVTIPDEVATLAPRLRTLAERHAEATAALEAAVTAREQAEAGRGELPPEPPLRTAATLLARADEVGSGLEAARTSAADARTTADAATEEAGRATARLANARETLAALERQHAAHGLAAHLEVGAPCPVCRHAVDEIPDVSTPTDLASARREVEAAEAAVRMAEDAQRRAETAATSSATRLEELEAEHRRLRTEGHLAMEDLGVEPDRATIDGLVGRIEEAERRLTAARQTESQARAAEREARNERSALDAERDRAWATLDETRDRAAALSPPPLDRDDLEVAWRTLVGWAEEQVPTHERSATRAREQVTATEARYREAVTELRQRCADADIDVPAKADPRDTCVAALERARAELEGAETRLKEAEDARERHAAAVADARVAKALGKHLDSRNFEKWLLDRALRRLVVGASEVLRGLTSGAYSLALGAGSAFEVVDHHNADERRPARTLSGGETFLASLALALSLADHVADLAAHGSARLEALFLDEGFGTLDAETLDTVAAAIEELGTRGRMVGLVTHVRELAERMPVRFEVRRTASTSTVEKVVA